MSKILQISAKTVLEYFSKYYKNLLRDANIINIQELSGGYVEKVYKIVVQHDLADKQLKEQQAYVFKTYMFGKGFQYDKARKLYLLNQSIGASLIFKKYVTDKAITPLLSDNWSYLEDLGNMFIAVFPFVKHKKVKREQIPLEVQEDVIRFIAKMHSNYVLNKKKIDKMAQKLDIQVPKNTIYEKLQMQLRERTEKKAVLVPNLRRINTQIAEIYEQGNQYARQFLKKHYNLLNFVPTRYLSHRDMTANNILFDMNWQIVGLVDFDRAKYMNFYRELWFYIFYSVIAPLQLTLGKLGKTIKHMIRVYLDSVKFNVDQKMILQGALIELVYWFTKSWSFEEYVENPDRFGDLMQRTVYMHEHFWEIEEVVNDGGRGLSIT